MYYIWPRPYDEEAVSDTFTCIFTGPMRTPWEMTEGVFIDISGPGRTMRTPMRTSGAEVCFRGGGEGRHP